LNILLYYAQSESHSSFTVFSLSFDKTERFNVNYVYINISNYTN